jgi:hypothetical protein
LLAAQQREEWIALDAAYKRRGNRAALTKLFSNPHAGIDLRKVRGRVKREQAHLDEEQAVELEKRYQEFAAAVQRLREG